MFISNNPQDHIKTSRVESKNMALVTISRECCRDTADRRATKESLIYNMSVSKYDKSIIANQAIIYNFRYQ